MPVRVPVRVAINGFGRIGRLVLRAAYETGREDIEFVAVNDLGPVETNAHLLKYDSVHGPYPGRIETGEDSIDLGKGPIKVTAERDPAKLPWRELGVDVALECTGLFTKRELAAKHLEAGAKRVLVSAPMEDADLTVVYGVNHQQLNNGHGIVSNASCTTNCLAPVVKVLNDTFGIVHGTMTTVHSYTNDQRLLDLPHQDLRRARSAVLSMIPTSTGAAKALHLVIPELKGKLDGFALRVPTPNVSVVDLTVTVQRKTTVDAVHQAFQQAAAGPLKGILAYSDDELVSIDFRGNPHSAIYDAGYTRVVADTCVKVLAWYDNEWGYSCRVVDLIKFLAQRF